VANPAIFHLPPYPPTGVLWWKCIISLLKSPSGMYIYPSLITILSLIAYFSSLRFFILAFFNSSTTFTTFSSPSCAFLILSLRFPSFTSVSASLTHFYLINVLFLLLFSTPSCQSTLWLSLLALPMLFPRTCFKVKLKHNKYKAH